MESDIYDDATPLIKLALKHWCSGNIKFTII